VPCEDCGGRRYNAQTLEVSTTKEHRRRDEMTIDQAAAFFSANPKIARPLSLLVDTGLGYLKLGQPESDFERGEANG